MIKFIKNNFLYKIGYILLLAIIIYTRLNLDNVICLVLYIVINLILIVVMSVLFIKIMWGFLKPKQKPYWFNPFPLSGFITLLLLSVYIPYGFMKKTVSGDVLSKMIGTEFIIISLVIPFTILIATFYYSEKIGSKKDILKRQLLQIILFTAMVVLALFTIDIYSVFWNEHAKMLLSVSITLTLWFFIYIIFSTIKSIRDSENKKTLWLRVKKY